MEARAEYSVNHEVCTLLIELGAIAEIRLDASRTLLARLKPFDHIDRLHWKAWDAVTQSLPTRDLINLIKGLTLAETSLRGGDWGSVSPVIWTYRELNRRDAEQAKLLAEWILVRTHNSYVPFGGSNHGARSYAEYMRRTHAHRRRIEQGLAAQRQSEERAEAERQLRQKQKQVAAQCRKTPIREGFLRELSQLPVVQQLTKLARDAEYPIEFYPTYLAYAADEAALRSLGPEVEKLLLEKLKGNHRGPWGKFKRRLASIVLEERSCRRTWPWDRKPWFR